MYILNFLNFHFLMQACNLSLIGIVPFEILDEIYSFESQCVNYDCGLVDSKLYYLVSSKKIMIVF